MMAFSHTLIGLSSWALTARYTGAPLTEFTIGAAMLGALLPDIDHPGSWLGRRLMPVSMLLSSLIGHRGLTHSLIAVVAMVAVIYWFSDVANATVLALAVGYLSHLGADAVTNSGIPALWPWRKRFTLALASTGGVREWLITIAFTGLSVWLCWEHWQQQMMLLGAEAFV